MAESLKADSGGSAPPSLGIDDSIPAALAAIEHDTRAIAFGMASDRATGTLLRALAAAKPGGRFLEIGTGTGLATAWIADGASADATLLTIDSDPDVAAVARHHLADDSRINFRIGDAVAILAELVGPYDLIFADAFPGKFEHLDSTLALLAAGGLYVIDDLLPQPNWPPGQGDNVRRLLGELAERCDLLMTRLDWSTGLVIAVKV